MLLQFKSSNRLNQLQFLVWLLSVWSCAPPREHTSRLDKTPAQITDLAERDNLGKPLGKVRQIPVFMRFSGWRQLYQQGAVYQLGNQTFSVSKPMGHVQAWPCGLNEMKVPRVTSRHLPALGKNRATQLAGDPVNLLVWATSQTQLLAAFKAAGWTQPTLLGYLEAPWRNENAFPISHLFLWGRFQDLAFSRNTSLSLTHRHHLRLWRSPWHCQRGQLWAGTVSRDIGIEWNTFGWRGGPTTHLIEPTIDRDRDFVLQTFPAYPSAYLKRHGAWSPLEGLNGNLDPYISDSQLGLLEIH